MRPAFLSIFLSAFCLTSFAQTQDDIIILLDKLNGQSEYITKDSSVLKLLDNGKTSYRIFQSNLPTAQNQRYFLNAQDVY